MGAQPLKLTMSAELHATAGFHDIRRRLGQSDVVPLLLGDQHAPASPGVDDVARHELQQPLVLVDVVVPIPVVLAPHTSVADDERGGVAGLAAADELDGVAV